MLDPPIMMQSRAHTNGSTPQNGIRQDAGASEMASATAVFSFDQIGITKASPSLECDAAQHPREPNVPLGSFSAGKSGNFFFAFAHRYLQPAARYLRLRRSDYYRHSLCRRPLHNRSLFVPSCRRRPMLLLKISVRSVPKD